MKTRACVTVTGLCLRRAGAIICLLGAACGGTLEPEPQDASGTYRGTTTSGDPIVLTLEQEGETLRGLGTVADQPVVLAGPLTWSAVGTLSYANGSSSLVRLTLSPDAHALSLQGPGQEELVLERGGTPAVLPDGPFSGTYRAREGSTELAQAKIVQAGPLISGVGNVLGEPAGISGRLTDPDTAEGVITYLDESQVRFLAERSPDGAVTLKGFGTPIVLEKD